MNLVILIGLAMIGIAHAGRGAWRLLRGTPTESGFARFWLPLSGIVLCLLGLLDGWNAALPVPVGYAGGGGGLALGPTGCVFALMLFAIAAWSDAACPVDPDAPVRDLRVAAILLALLAGDAFLFATGACLAVLLPTHLLGWNGARGAMLAAFAIAGSAVLLCVPAVAGGGLLADSGFVLLRAAGGGAGALLPILASLASMPLLGLWPAQAGFRHRCAFAPVWVPLTGILLGQFLLLRLLLDLAGPAPTPLWGAGLITLGVLSALRSAMAGLRDRRASGVIGSTLATQNGFFVLAIGLCLLARTDDLPVLAGTAFDAALLSAPTVLLAGFTALAMARAMEAEAGSGSLSRLGGLAQSMPNASLAMSAALLLLGMVPPGIGFCVVWLLVQVALATPMPHPGGVPVLSVLLVLLPLVASVLTAAGILRMCWVAALGRPRTPRGAAATDLDRASLRRFGVLLAVPLLVGLVPGGWLILAGGRTGSGILLGGDAPRHAAFLLSGPGTGAVLAPLPMVLLLLLCGILLVLATRGMGGRVGRSAPAWNGGAPPPPPWLPFGEPATQIAPATLALALEQALGWHAPRWARGLPTLSGRMRRGRAQVRFFATRLQAALARHGAALALGLVLLALLAAASGVVNPIGHRP